MEFGDPFFLQMNILRCGIRSILQSTNSSTENITTESVDGSVCVWANIQVHSLWPTVNHINQHLTSILFTLPFWTMCTVSSLYDFQGAPDKVCPKAAIAAIAANIFVSQAIEGKGQYVLQWNGMQLHSATKYTNNNERFYRTISQPIASFSTNLTYPLIFHPVQMNSFWLAEMFQFWLSLERQRRKLIDIEIEHIRLRFAYPFRAFNMSINKSNTKKVQWIILCWKPIWPTNNNENDAKKRDMAKLFPFFHLFVPVTFINSTDLCIINCVVVACLHDN